MKHKFFKFEPTEEQQQNKKQDESSEMHETFNQFFDFLEERDFNLGIVQENGEANNLE